MMPAGFLSLLLLTAVDGLNSEEVCSYQDVLNYLNLTRNNELFSMARPVRDYKQVTQVSLNVLLYAILDVIETDQTFIPYVWIVAMWQNEHIQWNPEDFCGIESVAIPTEVLWKPDISIEEMTEKDKAPPSPHLTIYSNGVVSVQDDMVLVSTCRMHVYKFPFDVQNCNLSFKSVVHSVNEIQLVQYLNSSEDTDGTMRTQYEWLFLNMTVTKKTVTMFNIKQDMLIYTISMKRRPHLYIVNFLLPILFFLCLDLASFLISDCGGEKIGFKVTVMLAVTVMQLILNEILPSSSNRIPLVVVYCIGIFGLMMLSLLETILVKYLMEKDSLYHKNKLEKDTSLREDCNNHDKANSKEDDKKWTAYVCDVSANESPAEPLKVSRSQPMEESLVFEKLSDELRVVVQTLTHLRRSREEEEKCGYWTRKTVTINRVFFIFYIIATASFLFCMIINWMDSEE